MDEGNLYYRVTHEAFDGIMTAFKEACYIHQQVNQEYDGQPYSVHLSDVFDQAIKYIDIFPEEDYQTILFGACFHDTIEDARLTYSDVLAIAKKYMDEFHAKMAAEIVYALTNEKGRNRAERANEKYYEGIRNTPYASFVKVCDRMANMKHTSNDQNSAALHNMYQKEKTSFLNSIMPLCQDISFKLPEDMIKDFANL